MCELISWSDEMDGRKSGRRVRRRYIRIWSARGWIIYGAARHRFFKLNWSSDVPQPFSLANAGQKSPFSHLDGQASVWRFALTHGLYPKWNVSRNRENTQTDGCGDFKHWYNPSPPCNFGKPWETKRCFSVSVYNNSTRMLLKKFLFWDLPQIFDQIHHLRQSGVLKVAPRWRTWLISWKSQ